LTGINKEGVFRETTGILVSEGFILDGIKKGRAIFDPVLFFENSIPMCKPNQL
jgi:hypothetical protein